MIIKENCKKSIFQNWNNEETKQIKSQKTSKNKVNKIKKGSSTKRFKKCAIKPDKI